MSLKAEKERWKFCNSNVVVVRHDDDDDDNAGGS